MSLLLQLLPLATVLALYAASFKLAARVLRTSRVSWLYAFQFMVFVFALTISDRLISSYFGALPLLLGIPFGLTLHLAIGAWFFRKRALTSDGKPIGWSGGVKLTAVAVGFLILTLALLVGSSLAILSLVAP